MNRELEPWLRGLGRFYRASPDRFRSWTPHIQCVTDS